MQQPEDVKEEPSEYEHNLEKIADGIQSGKFKNVVVLSGAGISVNAGIPDFRSKNGIFNTVDVNNPNLHLTDGQKEIISGQPEWIAHVELFRENPYPAYSMLSVFYSTDYEPTIAHRFVRLLHEHKLLKRVYTQNIDGLHEKSGVPQDKCVAVHGSISSAVCIECGYVLNEKEFDRFKAKLLKKELPVFCDQIQCKGDGAGLIKPSVVLYGEQLPRKYFQFVYQNKDLQDVDLLIIIGTSLNVFPVAEIVRKVPDKCTRLVINKEALLASRHEDQYDDIELIGDADETCSRLIALLGWNDSVEEKCKQVPHSKI